LKTILSEFRTRLEDKLEEINIIKDEVNYLQGELTTIESMVDNQDFENVLTNLEGQLREK